MNFLSASESASIPISSDQIKQTVREFLTTHFNVNDWYLGAHVTRLGETLGRSASYIRPTDRVLEVGSYGHIPLLVWRLFGPTSVYAYSLQSGYIGFGQGAIRSEGDPRTEFQCYIEMVNIEKNRWPHPDNNLDVVLCFEVLEHLREHPMFMMSEANRVLKDGGYFILTSPNSSSYHAIINILYRENPFLYSVYGAQREGMGHIKEYAVNELQLLVKSSGFEVITHTTFSPYIDEKDALFPELRAGLNKFGLIDELSGSTHFLVARKIGQPNFEYYQPLYDITKTWVPSILSGSVPVVNDSEANGALPASYSPETPLSTLRQNDLAEPESEKTVASILVSVQGEWEELPPCVDVLFDVRISLQNIEIVFVPHQLNPHQIMRLNEVSQLRRNTQVVLSDPALTFAQTLNKAAHNTSGQWLIFLDSNCRPKTGWLLELLRAASLDGDGILSAKTLFPPTININLERIHDCGITFDIRKNPRFLYQYCLARQPFTNVQREIQAITGSLMLIGRELFETIGGFDGKFSGKQMFFDLCFRVREAGQTIRLAPTCEVYVPALPSEQDPDIIISNDVRFMSKWGDRIHPDEIDHYQRDGLTLGPDGSMRIAMVTPLAPQKTGVADYVQELIPALSQLLTVDLFVDDIIPSESSVLSQHCVRLISDLEICHLDQPYDQIVYHIGNNSFHTAIYDVAARVGGVMVVHEYDSKWCKAGNKYVIPSNLESLRRDFDEWVYLSNSPDVAAAVQSGAFASGWEHFRLYGRMESRLFTRKQLGITTNKALWLKLFKQAAGIIVHNQHSKILMQAEFPALPVAVIPHLLSPKATANRRRDKSGARLRLNLPGQTFVIVSLGLIQPHKRNHITVQAFAKFVHQHPNSLLVLGGEAVDETYHDYLEHLIQELGLHNQVRITGWLSGEEFFDWISAGDVMVNLRYPSRGEESGTLIRILGSSKPTIVSDYAQYAEIPDDCVIKIPFVDEVQKLADALAKFAGDELFGQMLAENARQHYSSQNAVERVAKAYAVFCNKVQEKPWGKTFGYSKETQAPVLWELTGEADNDNALELALALDRAGVPMRVKSLSPSNRSSGFNQEETNYLLKLECLPLARQFVQVYSGPLAEFRRQAEASYAIVTTDHLDQTIAKWATIPVDEFWVPSSHSREQLINQGIPVEKIFVVPYGVSALAYATTIKQPCLSGPFTYLAIIDWSERSGWMDVLAAFLQEFNGDQDVRLCLRLLPDGSNTDGRDEALHHLAQFSHLHPEFNKAMYSQVSVESQPIAKDEMPLLYSLADAFIFIYHDSSFGRSLLEAMAIGLPVITLASGGQQDFINDSNAFILAGQSPTGLAEDNIQSLRAQMREVVDHKMESQGRGICARATVLKSWTWDHAAAKALRRLVAACGTSPVRYHILDNSSNSSLATAKLKKSVVPDQTVGFNVISYVSGNLGIGVSARNVIQVLLDNGYPVKLLDLDPGVGRMSHDLRFGPYFVSSPEELSYPINLFVMPPSDIANLIKNEKDTWLSTDHLNAAWSMWELPVVPPVWCEQMQAMDVLIAQSHFIYQTYHSTFPNIPTVMAVHPLYLRDGIKPQRKRFGLPENGVLFITSFEPYSDIERKNPMAVLESFRRAFDQSMQAHLIIKVNNPESNLFVKQLQQHYDGSSQIHIIAETMSYTDVLSLYASCDVYVSLHRAEGLGLGLMESMMLGKPVIATAWSGNMTFMNYTNSCPVNYHLVPVKGSIPVYRKEMLGKDAVWADPDIDDAAAWMRRLVDDPDIRTEIGRRAADNMQKWQANALNAKFIDELKIIWENRAIKRDEVALKSQRARWKIMGNQLFLGEKVD